MKPRQNHVIGLTGHMQAGKDSLGQALVLNHGYQRIGFADALKEMAVALNPVIPGLDASVWRLETLVQSIGWEEAKKYPEVRRFLQVLGTEGVRKHLGENAWVDVVAKEVTKGFSTPVGRWVITDVRFPNEAEWVKWIGGHLVRIVRPGFNGDGHASETFIDEMQVDWVVNNRGSLEHLDLAALAMLEGLNLERIA